MHCNYLKQERMKVSSQNVSMDTLKQVHQEILDQHEAISDALLENFNNPVTYDTLPEALGLDLNETEETNVEQESVNS